jgi:hypothetical protein
MRKTDFNINDNIKEISFLLVFKHKIKENLFVCCVRCNFISSREL